MAEKVSKAQVVKARNTTTLKKVLIAKGVPNGKLPAGKVAHHIKPVAEGGKTTKSNIRVVPTAKHSQIHSNRRKVGKI